MNALHQQWKADQARPRPHRHDTARLPVGGFYSVPGHVGDEPSNSTRRWPRTIDEAFRTPEWREPLHGPYRAPSALGDALWWLAVIAIALVLAAVGAAL